MTTSSPLWSASVATSGRRTEMSGGGAEAFMPHCPSAEAAGLTPYLVVASAATTLAWLARDRTLHRGRYTTVCIATLAVAVGLYEIGVATGAATAAGGLMASIAAGQLYTVAGIRKLRSPAFMSGRVLVDNVAFCAWRASRRRPGLRPAGPPPSPAHAALQRRVATGVPGRRRGGGRSRDPRRSRGDRAVAVRRHDRPGGPPPRRVPASRSESPPACSPPGRLACSSSPAAAPLVPIWG